MSRDLPVEVFENPAESLTAANFAGLNRPDAGGRRSAHRGSEVQGHVRPLPVVVVDVFGQEMIEVARAQDDEVIEALDLNALDQPLDVGVEVGRPVRQPHGADPGCGQCSAEGAVPGGELAVAVAEQKPGFGHAVGHGCDEPLHNLDEPRAVRIGGARRDVRPAGLGVDEHQREDEPEALRREHAEREEVARPQCLRVCFQELVPGAFTARRACRKPGFLQNVDDGRAGDAADPALLELAEDADILTSARQ